MPEQRVTETWLDRAVGFVSPARRLHRLRARIQTDLVARNYEAAKSGRRTQGWNRSGGDANAVAAPSLARLRNAARDLVRNNGHAKKALRVIGNHVVGWGIVAKAQDARARDAWAAWANTTACDSDGRNDMAGLQKLVLRTVGESGEALVRIRFRRPEDGLPIPLQVQVLDPDYIDTSKHQPVKNRAGVIVGRIVYGIEFDLLGRRVAYWLFPEHPGSSDLGGLAASRRIPAESVIHVYEQDRPGQVRGVTWFAPILLKFKDFDDYSDATLMKQKVAACLAVITSDSDGNGSPLGTTGAVGSSTEFVDSLEPGMILNVPPGRSIETVTPPTVREYGEYAGVTQREIAAGLGLSYEDFTGDYSQVNFSSARLARQSYWGNVEDWQRMLIGQFCGPVWQAAMLAASVAGIVRPTMDGDRVVLPLAGWTAPPQPMIDPGSEGAAIKRNIRAGIQTLYEAIRERGYDPHEFLAEYAEGNDKLDELAIVLDSDARKTSDAGLTQARPAGTVNPSPTVFDDGAPTPPALPPGRDDEGEDEPDEDDEEAERAHRERLALIDLARASATRPVRLELAAGAVQVDARTTVDARTRVQLPLPIFERRTHGGHDTGTSDTGGPDAPAGDPGGDGGPEDGGPGSGGGRAAPAPGPDRGGEGAAGLPAPGGGALPGLLDERLPGGVGGGAGGAGRDGLTARQAEAYAIICAEYTPRPGVARPVSAATVAAELGVSHERARTLFRRLYELGLLRSPGTPAVPVLPAGDERDLVLQTEKLDD